MTAEPLDRYQPGDDGLDGKVILVTGACGGIGREVCLKSAALGADLLLLDRNNPGLEALHDEIAGSCARQPVIVEQDLGQLIPAHCDSLAAQIQGEFGRLDALIHCAVHFRALAPMDHLDQKEWSTSLRVNLFAPFMLTRSMLPLLRSAARSVCIFSSIDQARRGGAYWAATAASFGGLERLTEVMADELQGDAVVVYSMDPGDTATTMYTQVYPGPPPASVAQPQTVARAYLKLLEMGFEGDSGGGYTVSAGSLDRYR